MFQKISLSKDWWKENAYVKMLYSVMYPSKIFSDYKCAFLDAYKSKFRLYKHSVYIFYNYQ